MNGRFLYEAADSHGSFCATPRGVFTQGTIWQCDCGKVYEAHTGCSWRGDHLLARDKKGRLRKWKCGCPERPRPALSGETWTCGSCDAVWTATPPYTSWRQLKDISDRRFIEINHEGSSYTAAELERICACGHRFGSHSSAPPHRCIALGPTCGCEAFRDA